MNKISRVVKFLYIIKLIKFLFFTGTNKQLLAAKQSKNEEKVLHLILAAIKIKIVLIIIGIGITNILLINNL